MSITVEKISHRYADHIVLQDVSFAVDYGEIVCILGPSGGGKSTLLRLLAGLEPIQQGQLVLNGDLLADSNQNPAPNERPVGLVFQDHILFPHLTVFENVAFGLGGMEASRRREVVNQALADMGMLDLGERYPHTLSGGQQHRVALVRALATQPSIMLLDEPFASVDTPLRRRLREEARQSLRAAKTATLMVTHDPEEALAMADKILVLDQGEIVQYGTPLELWQNPSSRFVGETLANRQTLIGEVTVNSVMTPMGDIPLERVRHLGSPDIGASIAIGIRGSTIRLSPGKGPVIQDNRCTGAWHMISLLADAHHLSIPVANSEQDDLLDTLTVGMSVQLDFTSADAVAYDRSSPY